MNNKMRQILFRGKRIDNGHWIEGYYFKSFIGSFIGPFNEEMQVIPESVGQFTGLTDKNGNKIFEGDILKDGNNNNFIVQWDECGWSIDNSWLYKTVSERKTIIGNIHDNPELI